MVRRLLKAASPDLVTHHSVRPAITIPSRASAQTMGSWMDAGEE
jgi:hypothetical protein